MSSLFTRLTPEQVTALLPKVQVAVALYRRHNTQLTLPAFREHIAQIDKDVGDILELVYVKKMCTRQDLLRWANLQEQKQDAISVQVTNPDRLSSWSFDKHTSISWRQDVWLFAVWQEKIYKRTLSQDIDKLLR